MVTDFGNNCEKSQKNDLIVVLLTQFMSIFTTCIARILLDRYINSGKDKCIGTGQNYQGEH